MQVNIIISLCIQVSSEELRTLPKWCLDSANIYVHTPHWHYFGQTHWLVTTVGYVVSICYANPWIPKIGGLYPGWLESQWRLNEWPATGADGAQHFGESHHRLAEQVWMLGPHHSYPS